MQEAITIKVIFLQLNYFSLYASEREIALHSFPPLLLETVTAKTVLIREHKHTGNTAYVFTSKEEEEGGKNASSLNCSQQFESLKNTFS